MGAGQKSMGVGCRPVVGSGCVHALGMLARSCSAQAGMDMGRQVCQISSVITKWEGEGGSGGSGKEDKCARV